MGKVGIIANPAAGKDIRRLVTQGRFVTNREKINVLKRILSGLKASGVDHIIMMPDSGMLGRIAVDTSEVNLRIDFLEMDILNDESDSSRAALGMLEAGVDCLVTLGGDGTNRAVVKGTCCVPIVPVSTGTNNVFPSMVEGTLAGLAAGVVANGMVELPLVTAVSNILDINIEGSPRDIALVDIAVCKNEFVGSRAVWDMDTVVELFLARAEPTSLGLSAIGAQLSPVALGDDRGIHVILGEGDFTVTAPIGPGVISEIPIREWRFLEVGKPVEVKLRSGTIALDGERTITLLNGQSAHVTLRSNGPRVVLIEDALSQAALRGVFTKNVIL